MTNIPAQLGKLKFITAKFPWQMWFLCVKGNLWKQAGGCRRILETLFSGMEIGEIGKTLDSGEIFYPQLGSHVGGFIAPDGLKRPK